jgi:hypothetical protein
MNRSVVRTSVAIFALMVPLLGTPDTKTNFSGTWEMDAARSESPHFGNSNGVETVVIKQTESEISVERRRDGQSETIVYKMDGSDTEKPSGDNGPYRWHAKWDGPRLTTETHRNVNGASVTILEVHTLGDGGREMTVNRTLTVQHGYQGTDAKNYASAKDVFVKAR